MKPASLLLTLSLAANLVGGGFLLVQKLAHPTASDAAVPSTTVAANAARDRPAAARSFWSRVASDDFATLSQNLRDSGMPPSLVNAVISGLIHERYADRLTAMRGTDGSGNYWQRPNMPGLREQEAYLAVQRERDELIIRLTGRDPRASPVRLAVAQRIYGIADLSKVPDLATIDSDYESLLSAYRVNGFYTKSDQAALALLEQERAADLAALLSPADLREYQLRRSGAAQRLQRELIYFQPTEEEYRQLFPLFQDFNRDHPAKASFMQDRPSGDAETQARSALIASWAEQLDPERARELELALKAENAGNNAILTRLGLPLSTSGRLNEIQASYRELVRKIAVPGGNNTETRDSVRAQAVAALQEVESLLGAEGMAAYRATQGVWLRGFDQLAAPPSTGGGGG